MKYSSMLVATHLNEDAPLCMDGQEECKTEVLA